MNYSNSLTRKKIEFINLQMLAIIGFIIALLISYLLSYDKKMSLEKKKRLFSNKEAQNLAVFQTILVFIVTLCFLFINYNQYKISKEEKQDSSDFILQIETSIFAIISSIIGLYIIFKNYNKENISISEVDTL